MWYEILFMLVSAGLLGYAIWPAVRDSWKRRRRPWLDAGEACPPEPESVEGVLAGRLAAAEISRRQYIRAMERLAARDDKRNPVEVPPEAGSAA
ncbi:hypothetical protein ODJ79_37575 [Actinoplanes sp. KI2]|uniref:hypothetical protein n=1 Tax=Actinoplanes sp. KI2 TaxID=2983315 RepID=UPI0021D5C06E|nr:hypothetical protein [Actinoplanes sp. KI2]MCU7729460.1 hypothetical protein [Actinoplanes sp. KI2]